ncbi:uncharacterized protein LOC128343714 [Hemicordylus capensis]|uniref:uncharacterized protein LOC128343714 n=1 Tax=Hemicordylus capensis TaxID=884348 RepID=UPI0023046AA8|nr:uncharacterized protein LOC128343714 [Hemicordylus capensis]
MASFKKMFRGLLEEAPSIQDTIGILKELHRYINSEKPRLQTLSRKAYIDALAHMARLPNVELATWKVFFRKEEELAHHDIQSTIKVQGVLFLPLKEKMASFKKMLRGLLEEATSIQNIIGILKELHRYINSEESWLQALGQEAYRYALAHVARLPNLEVSTLLWTWLQHPLLQHPLLHLLLQHPLWDPLSASRFRRRPPSGLWSHGGCLAAHLLERGCFQWGSPNAPEDSSREEPH